MTSSKFQILVPTDFSEQSEAAFFQSCRIAQIYDAEITLLHIIEDENAYFHHYAATSRVELIEKIDKQLKEFVKKEVAFSKNIVSCRIEFGTVTHQIIQTQQQHPFNMIVMGFNELKSERIKEIGSNSLQVIKHAPCQVITVKNKVNSGDFKSIILPLDLSKPTSQKVTKAIELAKSWKDACVNLISVLPICDELKVNTATFQLAQIVKEIEDNAIVCNSEIIRIIKGHENMADIVADYAQRIKSEIVMIITKHETGSASSLGTSTQSIMNNKEIPIFSIVPLVTNKSIYN